MPGSISWRLIRGIGNVHIRLEAQEQAQTDIADMPTSMEP